VKRKMQKDKIIRTTMVIFLAIALITNVQGLVCVTISNDNTWNDAKLKIGEEAFFSLVIYNSSAEGKYCEPARYGIDLSIEGENIDDIISWEIDPEITEIKSGGYARALIKITPKVEGYYEIKATTTLLPKEGSGGTKLLYGASATIKAHFSTTGEEKYNEIPFWKIRKDCPNGIVVKQGEECPSRVCEDKTYRYGNDLCPEDKEQATGIFALNIGDINLGDNLLLGISALILAIGIGGGIVYFGFVKKPKTTEAEIYEEQRYY